MINSFCSYQAGVSDDIWDLFKDWEDVDEPFEYVLEIVDAAASGRINLDDFNLSAYNKTIKKNENKANNRSKNKLFHIVEDIEDASVEPYGVPEAVVSLYAEQTDEFEKFENAEEVEYAVQEIRQHSSSVFCNYRIDVLHCIKQALKGLPDSIKLLKGLANDEPFIGNLIKIILESEQPFSELFPEIA